MNIREAIRNGMDRIAPFPSSTWEEYVQNARLGLNEDVPVYG